MAACGGGSDNETANGTDALLSLGVPQWRQADWSGGEGPSAADQYHGSKNIDVSTPGELKLATSEYWFDSEWKYRQLIIINNTEGLVTNYPVRLIVNFLTGMNPDFSDLRFTNEFGEELDFWVHSAIESAEADLWVEVDELAGSGDTVIHMYYGNESAVSASSGEETFIFFDGFDDDTIDPEKWTVVDPFNEISEDGGKLRFARLTNGGWNKGVYANATYARDDLSFEFDYQWMISNPSYDAIMFGWHDSGTAISYQNLVYAYYNPGSGGSDTVNATVYEDGSHRGGVSGQWTVLNDYDVQIQMRASSGAYYEQSEDGGDTWLTSYSSSYSSESDLRPAWSFYSGTHEFDNARVRKWMENEPVAAFGSVEQRYLLNGSLTSNIFETHSEGSIWHGISYVKNDDGIVVVKVRSSNKTDMSDAPDFSACETVLSGADLSDTNCVEDGHRYIQYYLELVRNNSETPLFNEIVISYDDANVVANAGHDITMSAGKTVELNGSASSGLNLQYNWALISGKGVLTEVQSPTPAFTAFNQAENQEIEIQLTVRNVLGNSETDEVKIHVIGNKNGVIDDSGIVWEMDADIVYRRIADNRIILDVSGAEIILPEGSGIFNLESTTEGQIIIGMPELDETAGRVYFITTPVKELSGPINLSDESSTDFIMALGNQSGDQFGKYIALGDINGDGIEEILIGAPGASENGMVYINDTNFNLLGTLVGTTDFPLNSLSVSNYLLAGANGVAFGPGDPAQNLNLISASLSVVSPIDYAYFLADPRYFNGVTVLDSSVVSAMAGTGAKYQAFLLSDLMQTGKDDLILASNMGDTYIYIGQQEVGTDLSTSDANVVLTGASSASLFGYTIDTGDVTGDGLVDLVIGAPKYGDNEEGAVFVIFAQRVWDKNVDITLSGYVLKLMGQDGKNQIGKALLLADKNGDGVSEIYTINGDGQTIRFDLTRVEANPSANVKGGCSLIIR